MTRLLKHACRDPLCLAGLAEQSTLAELYEDLQYSSSKEPVLYELFKYVVPGMPLPLYFFVSQTRRQR